MGKSVVPIKATLKLVCGDSTTDANGDVSIIIVFPANRYIKGAMVGFDNFHPGDRASVEILDSNDNKIASFTDEGVPVANRGWFIPENPGWVYVEGFEGRIIAGGNKLKIIGKKGSAVSGERMWVNPYWGAEGKVN